MTYKENYQKWLQFEALESSLQKELTHYDEDEKLQKDAFGKNLEFGTGGMRGELGPGTNRLNIYTIRKASQGVADYIKQFGNNAMLQGVAIAYDSRRQSKNFAIETATTFALNGIPAYVYDSPKTTPQLSYTVRKLKNFMGIMITASHNPPSYNGYKVYGEDGAQLTLTAANAVIQCINSIQNELTLPQGDLPTLKDSGSITIIDDHLNTSYLNELLTIPHHPELLKNTTLKTVFTPLHGASGETVQKMFDLVHYKNIHYVEEQLQPNGEFPTVDLPNPEEKQAFTYAILKGQQVDADILLAVDPDGDRVGLAVKAKNQYQLLSGNQTGAILLNYILSQLNEKNSIPKNAIAFKTIVTSELGRAISKSYDIAMEDVLTGFKFIGEKIKTYEVDDSQQFLFGYEESYGYLIKDFCRDKDAMQATLALTEAAAYYKAQNKTLLDVLEELYVQHGYFLEELTSITKKGLDGATAISNALTQLRENPLTEIAGFKVEIQEDYLTGIRTYNDKATTEVINLPAANVLKYFLEDNSWICVRPSGTEPKIKYYFGVRSSTAEESVKKVTQLNLQFSTYMDNLLS
ncbi:MAG: phospho-sugar mutase [Lysinibacillus sp.]